MRLEASDWPNWISGAINNFFRNCIFFNKTTQILSYYISQFHNIYECFSFRAKYRKYSNLSDFLLQL